MKLHAPPLPDNRVGKYGASFQFPQSLINVASMPWIWGVDQGFWGQNRLETHVVMCGFPRCGTTLCQLMCQTCIDDIQCYGEERKGLEKARFGSRRNRFLLTKRPSDIFQIERIRKFYANRPTNVRFVIFVRDPRAILTSVHAKRPGEYYVSVERWRAIYEFWNWAIAFDDVLPIHYEDLICQTAQVEQKLARFVGWQVKRPFQTFHENVPDNFNTAALNGVRSIDQANCDRWRRDAYAPRIQELLMTEMPELPRCLIELGYEENESWTEAYVKNSAQQPDITFGLRAA